MKTCGKTSPIPWNADPECIAITRNASELLQIAQFGLDLAPGDEVLTTSPGLSPDDHRVAAAWPAGKRLSLKQLDFTYS